ncbi:MAG TPA: hypothetical protein PLU80_20750, partial [Acidobacteriota bacterium]|nr:hypothetical protein [Acidobacteriota bacterium]
MLSPTEMLRVWHPPATLPASSLVQIGKMMDELATRTQIRLVKDPILESPTYTLNWTTSGWTLSGMDGTPQPLGTDLTIDVLKSALAAKNLQAQRVFINLPPSIEFSNRMQLGQGRRFNTVKITPDPVSAQYVLLGRWHNQELQYTWALPNTNPSQKTLTSLPVITDWIACGTSAESQQKAIEQLEQFALRIGKIRAWLTLESPPDSVLFPYHIALKNDQTGEVNRQGIVRKDEIYRFLLQAHEGIQNSKLVETRYVYLFLIDRNGNTVLLFPRPDLGNVENLVPYRTTSTALPPKEFLLGNKDDAVTIGEPFGTDTYVFLSSVVPLENPGMLESEGVRIERATKPYSNPLEYLLANLGTATRGSTPTPLISDWSIERITLQSVDAQ